MSNSSNSGYGSLLNQIDKLGKQAKLKLLRDLSIQGKFSEADWQNLAPFWIPEELRRKGKQFPWSLENQRNLGLRINVPICLQDPQFVRDKSKLDIEEIEVSWEPELTDGPTSARIAVEDFYGEVERPPAKWDEVQHCFVDPQGQRIIPQLNNDQFHQINVWAIAQRILNFYEDFTVLGRPVPWGFNGNRLIIKPHASTEESAEKGTGYDPITKTLNFSITNDTIYTCLSHDIVAHETGHTVLDGIRPHLYDSWLLETKAFHEFIADLTAIMSALRNNYVRKIFIDYLEKGMTDNFLSRIAEEFGKATSTYNFVRNAQNKITMDHVRQWEKDCPEDAVHNSSQVLSGLMYDLLINLYDGYKKRGSTPGEAAWHATRRLTQMALQPLDFLPPIDVTFSDYVEAFLIRDELLDPVDEHDYRSLFRDLCEERGIPAPQKGKQLKKPHNLENPYVDGLLASSTSAYTYIHSNRKALHIPAKPDVVVDVYAAQKVDRAFVRTREIIVQYIWIEWIKDLLPEGKGLGDLEGKEVPLLCGGTLVFDESSNFRYWVTKPGIAFQPEKKAKPKKKGCAAREDADPLENEHTKGKRRVQELKDYITACLAKKDTGAVLDIIQGRFVTRL